MLNMTGSSIMPISSFIGSGSALGRVGVPVAKSQAIYAQFEHVYGVPTEGGVRIDRARILDALIDEMSAARKARGLPTLPRENSSGLNREQLESAIGRYQRDIKAAIDAPAAPYRPRPSLPRALAFSISG